MIIVIPMAGFSRRFVDAGYSKPKYMLEAGGVSLFRHAVQSFRKYFDTAFFVFVHRDTCDTGVFINNECSDMGIKKFLCVELDDGTRGQAETVAIGLERSGVSNSDDSLIIFNIDTVRPGYRLPEAEKCGDAYLEVFRGEGDGWSFVRPMTSAENVVAETTEKVRVSDLCSTGVYYFKRADYFMYAFKIELESGPSFSNEYYVAPLYNHLIRIGIDVRYFTIDASEVIFSGVPAEYESFRSLCAKSLSC